MNVMDQHIVRFLQVCNGTKLELFHREGKKDFLEVFTGQPMYVLEEFSKSFRGRIASIFLKFSLSRMVLERRFCCSLKDIVFLPETANTVGGFIVILSSSLNDAGKGGVLLSCYGFSSTRGVVVS